jgi:hypothetical protein
MKLRIKGNTIRFRLTKSEVDYFSNFHFIKEETVIGKNIFAYSLQVNDKSVLSATMNDNTITIFIPENKADEWAKSNIIGLNGEMDIGDGKKLFLLVEKDFKCLDETSEDQSDNYDNPLAQKMNA